MQKLLKGGVGNGPKIRPALRSLISVAPKHDGGWCIIYNLSAPVGFNINDFIDSSMYSLSYCLVDDAYAFIDHLRRSRNPAK